MRLRPQAPKLGPKPAVEPPLDLEHRREALKAQVARLQFDLGGLAYEMAIRDHIRPDVLIRRAAALQQADAELGEVERMIAAADTAATGACENCGALRSRGAAFCWQCGQPLMPAQTEAPAADSPTAVQSPNGTHR